MTLRSTLRNSVSRFAHLSQIAPKAAAKKEKAEDEDVTPAAEANEKAEDEDVTPAAEAAEKSEDEDDDEDEDDEEDDEDQDEDEVKKAKAAGHGPALKIASKKSVRAERRRCAAIFASPHAQGRVPMAAELAFPKGRALCARDAIRLLAASPEEKSNGLATALAAQPRRSIGTELPRGAAAETPRSRLLAAAENLSKPHAEDSASALLIRAAEKLGQR